MQEQCADFRFDVGGVFQRESDFAWWPLEAAGPVELEERLTQGGHLLPLPREPAALANVLEVSIVNFLALRVLAVAGAQVHRGTERGYPDFEIGGPAFGGGFHAVDVKAARRAPSGRQTQSRITWVLMASRYRCSQELVAWTWAQNEPGMRCGPRSSGIATLPPRWRRTSITWFRR
jgi:hypothetical protein